MVAFQVDAMFTTSWVHFASTQAHVGPIWTQFAPVLCFVCHVVTQPDLGSSGNHFATIKKSFATYEAVSYTHLTLPTKA